MLFVMEGPDCGGKDWQSEKLISAYRESWPDGEVITIRHGPPDPPDRPPFEEYEAELLARLPADPETLVICNRHSLGELIYGPLLRGGSRLTLGGELHIELLLMSLGATRWAMIPPLSVLSGRLLERGDDLVDTGELAFLHEMYTLFARSFGYQVLRDGESQPRQLTMILDSALDRAIASSAIRESLPGYIGSLSPSCVLAGDVRSGASPLDDDFHRSAFTPATPGSAEYLMNSLATYAKVLTRPAGLGILNTGEDDMALDKADELLGAPRWIALGVAAARRLEDAGIDAERVPHPSWARRFRARAASEYGMRLMDLGGFL